MNRKILGGVIAFVVVVVGVWLLWFRGGADDATKGDDEASRSGKVALKTGGTQAVAPRSATPRWSLDADPEGPLQLEGQVVDGDGKGVGGAEVWIASVPPRHAKSEDDGTFSFDKLVSRTYTLSAQTDGLVGGPVTYKLTATSDPVIVRLQEGAGVTALVVDDAKQPIAGARVRIYDFGDRSATTDAKGAATIRPVHPGYVAVQAIADGYAPNMGYATVGTAGVTGSITITLHKGFALSGRVIDEAGKPIAKAKVYASGGEWTGDWSPDNEGDDKRDRREVTSDDDGKFTIPALSTGSHSLIAVDGEHAPGHTPVTIDDRPLTGVEITMKAGGVIAGIVVDKDKKPVGFVPVRVAGTGNQQWTLGRRQAISDKDGKFELRGLVRTKLQARAEADHAASNVVQIDLTQTGTKRDVVLALELTGTISGVVVGGKGAPVPEVQVNAFPDIMGGASTEALALADMSSAVTDGSGAFTITGLPDGAYKLWVNRGSQGEEWSTKGTAAKTGDKNVRITLASPGTLVGKLAIEGAGAPAMAMVHVGYQAPVPTTTGAFEIKSLAPGKYHVTFRGREFAEMHTDVEITADKTTDLGTVKVFRGRKLVGKVVDGSGAPVANAKVKLAEMLFSVQGNEDQAENWEEIAGVRSTVSDQDGGFTLIGVPTKATSAMADSPKGRSLAIAIPEGADDPPAITLALRGFGSITGKVLLKGQPAPGVTITESSKGGASQASFGQTDDAGVFTLQKVTEGPHVLQAMQSKVMSFKSTTVNVNVTAGRETKVTIDIPVGQITLTVSIKPIAGAKVDAAQVFLFAGAINATNAKQLTDSAFQGGMQGMRIWFGISDPEFDELMPGDYSVCTIPVTGPFSDPQFQQQLQANMALLKVYCKPIKIPASPVQQKVVHEVPGMDPLPTKPPA